MFYASVEQWHFPIYVTYAWSVTLEANGCVGGVQGEMPNGREVSHTLAAFFGDRGLAGLRQGGVGMLF